MGKWIIPGGEKCSEIVNPKFVVYSVNDYLLNIYFVSRLGAEYTVKQVDTFWILKEFTASHSKYKKLLHILLLNYNCEKDYVRVIIGRSFEEMVLWYTRGMKKIGHELGVREGRE